ncbi:hypothetical protein D3C85_1599560 [compost metagenome]
MVNSRLIALLVFWAFHSSYAIFDQLMVIAPDGVKVVAMMLPGYGLPLPMQRWVWTALSNCRLKLSTQALSSPTCTPLMRRPLMSLKLKRRWLVSG